MMSLGSEQDLTRIMNRRGSMHKPADTPVRSTVRARR